MSSRLPTHRSRLRQAADRKSGTPLVGGRAGTLSGHSPARESISRRPGSRCARAGRVPQAGPRRRLPRARILASPETEGGSRSRRGSPRFLEPGALVKLISHAKPIQFLDVAQVRVRDSLVAGIAERGAGEVVPIGPVAEPLVLHVRPGSPRMDGGPGRFRSPSSP